MKAHFLFAPVVLLMAVHCFSQTGAQKKTTTSGANPVLLRTTSTKAPVTTEKILTTSSTSSKVKIDSTKANLQDLSFSVTTARSYIQDPGTNKADTHWSCVLFDENGRQVASFLDNSNTDEYVSGSETPLLKMHSDNAAVFGDFSKGGRLHLSITPNGNDTWEISSLKLSFDFANPKFTQQLSWGGIKLTQDNKDIDLLFNQVNNAVPKYDIKANKEGR